MCASKTTKEDSDMQESVQSAKPLTTSRLFTKQSCYSLARSNYDEAMKINRARDMLARTEFMFVSLQKGVPQVLHEILIRRGQHVAPALRNGTVRRQDFERWWEGEIVHEPRRNLQIAFTHERDLEKQGYRLVAHTRWGGQLYYATYFLPDRSIQWKT